MAKAAACPTTNSVITVSDINTVVNCEPRVHDLRLAEALGFSDRHMIRALVRRHMATLRSFGEVSSERKEPTARGGRPGTDYYLNKRQALYITAKSDTERAALVTVQMVEVFDAVTRSPRTEARANPADLPTTRAMDLPEPSPQAVPAGVTPSLIDLFAAACKAMNGWTADGMVQDRDAALWVAFRATLKAAGIDATFRRAPGGQKKRPAPKRLS